jgi:hypothetical protein
MAQIHAGGTNSCLEGYTLRPSPRHCRYGPSPHVPHGFTPRRPAASLKADAKHLSRTVGRACEITSGAQPSSSKSSPATTSTAPRPCQPSFTPPQWTTGVACQITSLNK